MSRLRAPTKCGVNVVARRILCCKGLVGQCFRWFVALLLFFPSASVSDEPVGNGDPLAQTLAAGEFAVALRSVAEMPRGNQQDLQFERIAMAQANAGAHQAAVATVGRMSDDRRRSYALREVTSNQGDEGFAGGGAQADFDSLMELIRTTVAPTSWDDVGGPGAIQAFPGGVLIDVKPALTQKNEDERLSRLAMLSSPRPSPSCNRATRPSPLRKISLPRLERHLELLRAAGRDPDETMLYLAGLRYIDYVMVYPDCEDLVIAGPAGAWRHTSEGRIVSTDTNRPVIQLDDLIVLLRHFSGGNRSEVGCAITPTPEGLAAVSSATSEQQGRSLWPGGRERWIEKLRKTLGPQAVEFFGVSAKWRVSRVMLEADYHMKLIGLDLVPGTVQATSYFDVLDPDPEGGAPPMDVLRWWFTLTDRPIRVATEGNVYGINRRLVQVLCENELLDQDGRRRHTGRASVANLRFARNFTKGLEGLGQKYELYADLENVFAVAVTAALIQHQHLVDRIGWQMSYFGSAGGYQPAPYPAVEEVATVANCQELRPGFVVGVVSGGVSISPASMVRTENLVTDETGRLESDYQLSCPEPAQPIDQWWWD